MNEKNSSYSLIAQYYQQHFEELKAFACKHLGYADIAGDLVQTAFLRLLSSKKMISQVTLPCLVYTVMRNLIFDYWRRKHYCDEYEHYIQQRDAAKSIEPESVYSAVEINEMMERGMARLSEKHLPDAAFKLQMCGKQVRTGSQGDENIYAKNARIRHS